jgi:hypothetical protein
MVAPLIPKPDVVGIVDRSRLPDLPRDWDPDSVSRQEKEQAVAEKLIQGAGFSNLSEHYCTPEEISVRMRHLEAVERVERVQEGRKLIENDYILGMDINHMTRDKLRQAQAKYDIDPLTGLVKPPDLTPTPIPYAYGGQEGASTTKIHSSSRLAQKRAADVTAHPIPRKRTRIQ